MNGWAIAERVVYRDEAHRGRPENSIGSGDLDRGIAGGPVGAGQAQIEGVLDSQIVLRERGVEWATLVANLSDVDGTAAAFDLELVG